MRRRAVRHRAQIGLRRGGLWRTLALWSSAALGLCHVADPGPHRAGADITIRKPNGDPVPETSATREFNPKTGGWTITLNELYAPGLNTVFEIHADGGETIDTIISNVNGPPAGSPVIIRALGDAPGGLNSVGSIIQFGNAETLLNRVEVSQDIGLVLVEAVGDLIAGRDVIGPVIATTSDNTIRGITTVQAGRDIVGDLVAENGRIVLAWAQRHLGSAADPILIRAKHNVLHVMGQDVFADIETRANGGTGGLWALVADRYFGRVDTEQLIFNPYNSVHGLILIHAHFGGTVSIGKSYNNPAQYIQVPVAGLAGQIIINADNVAGGTWAAPVRVGGQGDPAQIVLNGPNYAHQSSALGGGSVGLVPFRLHDESCTPASGATAEIIPGGEPLTVHLRHYGPVVWNAGKGGSGEAPVTIERRVVGSLGPFSAAPPADFQIGGSSSFNSPNVIEVGAAADRPGFAPGYQYRIRPTDQLRCAVPAQPPVVWDSDYIVTVVVPSCDEDVNADGLVSVSDLLLVIYYWGPAHPALPGADVNDDGLVNVTDLLLVIGGWGPCW